MYFQAGYVDTEARNLEVLPGANDLTQVLPTQNPDGSSLNPQLFVPFPDFGRGTSLAQTEGNSRYHGLQLRLEKQFANGLNFFGTYTYSKVLTDAHALLNGGSIHNSPFGNINPHLPPESPGI